VSCGEQGWTAQAKADLCCEPSGATRQSEPHGLATMHRRHAALARCGIRNMPGTAAADSEREVSSLGCRHWIRVRFATVPSGAGAVVEVGDEGSVAASAHFPAQRRVG
jgi:hypothetical protein